MILILDPDLETLLGSSHTRNLFLDDVMELKEFLAQRIHELSTESSSMLDYGQVYRSNIILIYIYCLLSLSLSLSGGEW